jgi:hypothetical protein
VSKREKVLVGGFVGAAVPFTLMVVGWWGSASLLMTGLLRVTDAQIAAAAWAGLALGLLLDFACLRKWIDGFYYVDLRLLAPVYLFWTVIATAFFMGLPLGNLLLGAVAGAYIGRRAVNISLAPAAIGPLVRRVSIFTGIITSAAALGIGFLAAREPYTLAPFRRLLGLERVEGTMVVDLGIVSVAVLVLAGIQVRLTRQSAVAALRLVVKP